jgi:thiol-disulfide isomerase/thioredoxin
MSKYVNVNSSSMKLPTGIQESNGLLTKMMTAGGNISTNTFIMMFVIVVFICIGVYYYYYGSSSSTQMYYSNHEGKPKSSSKEAEILLFYVDWCPHCKTAKPAWEEIKAQYENKTINGYTVIFTEINCTEETEEITQMMNKYNIEGFPTIKLLKDGQVIEYDAKPTKDTLDQFLNTVL